MQSNSKKKHDEMLKKCNSAFSISVGKDHSKSEEEHHSNGLKYDSLLASILDELDNSCLVNTLANIEQEKDLHDLLVKLNDTKLYKILNKLVEQLDDSQLDIIFNKLVAYILNKLAENPDQDNPDKKLIDDILTGSIAKLVESQSKNIWKILKGSEPKLDKNQFNNDSSVQKYNQRNPELVNNYIQLIRILKQLYDDNRLYDHRLLEILKIDNANHKNSVKEAAISLLAKILYGLLIQDKYLVKIKQENQPNKSLFNTVLNELLDQHKQENQLDNTWLIKLLQHLVNNSNNTLLVKILHCIDKSDKLDYSQLIKILDYIVDPLNYRQLDPPNYIQLINIGDDLRLKPEYHNSERAIDCYDRAIRMNPEQPVGWYCRGLASTELGKNDEEEDLSQLNSSQGYLQKAINDYEKSLELKNDLDWAFYDRGIAYYWMGRIKEKKAQLKEKKAQQKAKEEYRKAIKDFDEAIKINSEYDDAWFYRGLVLHCLKYYDQAIASYDKAIQICHSKELIEGEVKYLYNRGLSYEKLELYDEAIASYKEAISYGKPNTNDIKQDKENYIKNWYQWGLILLYKLKKYPEAIEKFKQVTELQITLLNNKHKGALYNWGYALYELKEYSQACHQFEEVTNLNNNHEKAYYYWHEKAYYYWGLALYKLKNYSEACDKFEQVVTYLNPKHEKAYYYWGLALYDWANWGLPLYSWFNSFLYIYAWYYCVLALYELEKYSEAYDKFEQETLLNSEHKDAWYYYVLALYAWYYYVLALYTCYFWGLALYEVEKYSGACDKFEQVTNLNPEHEDALDQWYSALNKLKNKNSNNLNSLQEKYENAKYSCGLAFYKQGEYKKAIRQFETVIELNKEHERAWHYFNLALNKVKDKNLTNDKEVIDLINKHGIDWHEFGDTLKKEKEYEKAITQFEAIIKLNDKDKISWDLWVLALAKFVGCKKVIKWFMEGIKNCNKFAIKQYYRVEARFKSGLTEIVLDKEEEAQDKQKATQKT
ncbi:MAG: tetratricopeptide repeat protein [Xenococcus sp. (in: cyanobacteria)]